MKGGEDAVLAFDHLVSQRHAYPGQGLGTGLGCERISAGSVVFLRRWIPLAKPDAVV